MSVKLPMKDRNGNVVDYTFVSPEDYDKVSQYNWCVSKCGRTKYAQQTINCKSITLHRFLLGNPPEGMIIQHIDGNGLNNVRENIQFATWKQQAQRKARKKQNTSSKYLGLCWDNTYKYWQVYASGICLRSNKDEIEAAKTYDTFVLLYHGKDAQTNNLVSYNDIKHIDIETLKATKPPRELPKYISYGINSFLVRITYNKKLFLKNTKTLEEAKEVLIQFQDKIDEMQRRELEQHNSTPILRNDDGDAIIPIKDVNGTSIEHVTVSDDVWHKCMSYSWSKNGQYYASHVGKITTLHRFIMNAQSGDIVDHIDKNTKNNKTNNLRFSTASKNVHNKSKNKNASTSYLGVSFHKRHQTYSSRITKDGKSYWIGSFKTEKEAAQAYNEKAKELYGEYANLNVIP